MQKHEQASIKTKNCKHCTNFRQNKLTKSQKHGIIKASKETLDCFNAERNIIL